jgi:uncharacterized protein YukE/predicted transcriptional regulator
MAKDSTISVGIVLEGEKEFKQAISEINQANRVLESEMKKVTAEFEDNGKSAKDLASKQDVLERQMLTQADKVKVLQKALQGSAQQYGEADRRTMAWQISLNNAEAELAQMKNQLDKTTKELNEFGNEAKQAGDATDDVGKKGGMLSAVFAGGFLANAATTALNTITSKLKELAAAAFDTADELMRLSDVTGLSTDRLQELQYIGDNVGVSLDTVTSSLKRLTANMDTAKTGTGEAYEAFEQLGVSFRDSVTGELLDSNEVFNNVIDALGKMKNETERNAVAQDLLGKSATELNPIIKAGSAAMKELAQEAHDANAVMSKETVEALDTAGDRLSNWWTTLKAITGEGIVAVGNYIAGNEKAAGAALDTLTSLGDKIEEINAAYESAYEAAQASVEGQIGLWEDMGATANKTYSELKVAVVSQIRWLQDYSTNLANLSGRQVDGVDELVQKLSDGTKESASIVAGLATASDAQIAELINNMNEVDDRQVSLSRQMADLKTDTEKQFKDLYSGLKEAAGKSLDAAEEAKKAAIKTMNGYIAGITSKKDEVNNAFKSVLGSLFPMPGNDKYQPYGSASYSNSGNAQGTAGSQPITITPGAVVLNIDGRQVASATYQYTVERSEFKGLNLIK